MAISNNQRKKFESYDHGKASAGAYVDVEFGRRAGETMRGAARCGGVQHVLHNALEETIAGKAFPAYTAMKPSCCSTPGSAARGVPSAGYTSYQGTKRNAVATHEKARQARNIGEGADEGWVWCERLPSDLLAGARDGTAQCDN